MEKEILEMMQSWLYNRTAMVDRTIDNINDEANNGNENAKTLQKLDESTLRKATNEALNKKATTLTR